MRIRFNPRWLLVTALFFSLQLCRANNLTFNFDTNNAPLWDLSGLYSFTLNIQQRNGAVVPVSLSFNMRQDGAGHLHGFPNDQQGITLDENSFFAVTYTISGRVTGPDLAPTAHFVVHFTGFGGSSGLPQGRISATLLVDAAVSPDGSLTLEPIKPFRFVATLPQTTVRGSDFASTIPLPPGVDGSWSLNLQFDTFHRTIGTAVIATSSQNLGCNLFGVFTGTSDLPAYTLRMTGSRDVANTVSGIGSKATVFLSSSSTNTPLDTISINGRLMGERINF